MKVPAPKGIRFLHRTSRTSMTARCLVRVTGDAEASKLMFARFVAAKDEIERAFGGPMEWLDEPGSVGAQILTRIDPGGYGDPEAWEATSERAVDAMLRLEGALRPIIDEIDAPE